ncbi:MAG: histidinol-phosphatase HisJ family protein [Ruminococcaceae bacterium]|nr:histidinol-phosphatase HisJ family protein [Oscillospiraceae bacterium]
MIKANYHTHSTYCDGNDSLEQMTLAAIEKGFDTLGFSGHSYTFFDEEYCMTKENTVRYQQDIASLKEKYAGKIQLLCGIEQDMYSTEDTGCYDYAIGSAHYVKKGSRYLAVDNSAQQFMGQINELYDGNCYAFCEDYFSQISSLYERTGCDIIGHFDLVTKFNEGNVLFDESHPRYREAAETAATKLIAADVPFEINTGAMAKKLRTSPYPATRLCDFIAANGGRFILSSDCHSKNLLDFGFDEIKNIADHRGWSIIYKLLI